MKVSFHGAAREVTGSCHLIEARKKKVLIDCGMFQGGNATTAENYKGFGFNPAQVDHLLLTHAHCDHTGRIPQLVKAGFKGDITSTAPSSELAKLVMLDSAHLQEEDAKRKHGQKREPLYSSSDVEMAMRQFKQTVNYGQTIEVAEGIRATFFDAGHILGSAFILLEIEEGGMTKSILFSGDLGNKNKPIVRNTAKRPDADFVVSESTYGDRIHKPLDKSIDEFYGAITSTFEAGGNVFIPTFAIERAQEIIYFLREGIEKKKLPKKMQVFLDSPMAIRATEIFRRHPEFYADGARSLVDRGIDPFYVPGLQFTQSMDESKSINDIKSGAVILAGSGMCNGGRILHHMRNNLQNPANSFIFINYASRDSLPRRIIDGVNPVRIYGEEISVRAKLHTINGFSAHADKAELISWHGQAPLPLQTFLVHGSIESMKVLSKKLATDEHPVVMPEPHEVFKL